MKKQITMQEFKSLINEEAKKLQKTIKDKAVAPKAAEPKSSTSKGAVSGDSDVRSPTSTDVRSPTRTATSTDAYTSGNITVTGGAGAGDTEVNIKEPGSKQKAMDKTKSKSGATYKDISEKDNSKLMKKQITMQELKSIIKEEAQKLQRRTILEGEKNKLMEELGMIKK